MFVHVTLDEEEGRTRSPTKPWDIPMMVPMPRPDPVPLGTSPVEAAQASNVAPLPEAANDQPQPDCDILWLGSEQGFLPKVSAKRAPKHQVDMMATQASATARAVALAAADDGKLSSKDDAWVANMPHDLEYWTPKDMYEKADKVSRR